jgi:hypothetical protein
MTTCLQVNEIFGIKSRMYFSNIFYIGNNNLFYSAWTVQYDKIIGFITEVQFMAGEIFSPIPAFTALRPMLLPIPWVLKGWIPGVKWSEREADQRTPSVSRLTVHRPIPPLLYTVSFNGT